MAFYSGSLLLDLLGLLIAVIAVGYAYFSWSYQYWKKKNIPYLEPVAPWGNFQSPFSTNKSFGEQMVDFYRQAKPKGWKYFGIYALTHGNLVAIDLDLVKQVMTKDFHNFVERGDYSNEKDDPMSGHLFAIGGVKWRNLRTKLSPTFTSGKLKSMFSTLVDCGLVLEKYVEGHIDNEQGADIKEILGKFSTDIIGSCAFGLECNSFKDANSPFREHSRRLFKSSTRQIVVFTFANSFPNIARKLGIIIFPREVTSFFRKVVEETITYRQKNNLIRNDFLQLLIGIMENNIAEEEGNKGDGRTLTMDKAAAQCFVFFLAGFETSSTTMTFALYELAQHQDIQDRVREEIKTVLAKHDNKMTYDSLSELKYLKQVIDETLRLYSPLPFVTRMSAEDYKIPGEDVVIEKGTKVFIPIQAIHTDEEYYENPLVFDPERFSEENKAGRHPYAHIPFGEGPRICIGERFGVMQTKVGLTSILRKFRVTLNKKTRVPIKLSTKSFIPTAEDGIWINFEKL
ncbi:probable cytochrome P450 6a14 isoform X2 [Anoplophora glabripennis]|uniref:probable cytochrome P450 6a14 isoform X1 n=1 Tax=Anoplophora glabripennis TaxID=217634 RepID=UPI000874260C|nr:probable cytochrome P450 6a14 isoform X1 [Anoplophora glabripennis]XP_018577097.1 probable cytochrome P450 6a14 isoform X1 [Anoplophora glabripennis]XP_023311068.1 probable cytochrome P450 6a14 isoform X2 [Anoplophora glabripennis]